MNLGETSRFLPDNSYNCTRCFKDGKMARIKVDKDERMLPKSGSRLNVKVASMCNFVVEIVSYFMGAIEHMLPMVRLAQ